LGGVFSMLTSLVKQLRSAAMRLFHRLVSIKKYTRRKRQLISPTFLSESAGLVLSKTGSIKTGRKTGCGASGLGDRFASMEAGAGNIHKIDCHGQVLFCPLFTIVSSKFNTMLLAKC